MFPVLLLILSANKSNNLIHPFQWTQMVRNNCLKKQKHLPLKNNQNTPSDLNRTGRKSQLITCVLNAASFRSMLAAIVDAMLLSSDCSASSSRSRQ